MGKLLEIFSCNQCEHSEFKLDLYWCKKEADEIPAFPKIPKYCSLEDAKEPTNQQEQVAYCPKCNEYLVDGNGEYRKCDCD